MAGIKARFDKFISNLQLTDAQLKDAITKHNGVRKALHNAFYPSFRNKSLSEQQMEISNAIMFEYELIEAYKSFEVNFSESKSFTTSLLVGSYGKGTEIRPPSDIDILFKMPSNLFDKYDKVKYNGQSVLLQEIREVLLRTYPNTESSADGQIVLVPFTTYKVEVLPVFTTTTKDTYFYPDTNNGGTWRSTNPKAEKDYLSSSNKRSKGNTIRMIKMLKAWKRFCNVPIKSLAIELRTVKFLESYENFDKSAAYYDWMLRDFFQELIKYVNGTCQIPGISEKINYGDAWKAKAEIAYKNATLACEYEKKQDNILATIEWKKIFGAGYED